MEKFTREILRYAVVPITQYFCCLVYYMYASRFMEFELHHTMNVEKNQTFNS